MTDKFTLNNIIIASTATEDQEFILGPDAALVEVDMGGKPAATAVADIHRAVMQARSNETAKCLLQLGQQPRFDNFDDFMKVLLAVFPNAEVSEDDGELHIYTGLSENPDGSITSVV